MKKYIAFIKAVIEFVDRYMNFGEAGCPFCGHYHNHHATCLYLKAQWLLDLTNETE